MPRILHIEDDPANRLLVRKLLQAAGHEVIEAADGLEGVRLALGQRPDLVLVDLNIPGLDGFEVALRLRGEPSLAGVPIVAITAEGDRETSLAVGCDGFLQKPIDARSFSTVLQRYLKGAKEAPALSSSADRTARLREQSQRIVAHLEEKVAELSSANARLRRLDSARTEFYRNISHELATPMTPIVGYVKLLKDEELGPLTKAQQKALRSMDDCVRRLRLIIDNLLDVTGMETGRMRFHHGEYDVLDTTRRAVASMADRMDDARLQLVEDLPRGPFSAWGDANRLQRGILHLLDNAAKFTPEGGTVGVRVRKLPSGHYEICVADSGPGVRPDRASRIFEPFFQVDGSVTREHGGVGVGLAIARRTARGLGGDLRVVSPSTEIIEGIVLGGAAFYLSVSNRAPLDGDPTPGRPWPRAPGRGCARTIRPPFPGAARSVGFEAGEAGRSPLRWASAADRSCSCRAPGRRTRESLRGPGRVGAPGGEVSWGRVVYLDWNATTPPHPDVVDAMARAWSSTWANPASVHGPGRRARALVEAARDAVARLVGLDARDVVLTSGGTEANNLAIRHLFEAPGGALVVSRVEHPSVIRVAEHLAGRGVPVTWVDPAPSGRVEPEAMAAAVERGLLRGAGAADRPPGGEPRDRGDPARGRGGRDCPPGRGPPPRRRGPGGGPAPASVWEGADLVAVAAHKIRGPKGIGALATRPGLRLRPLLLGGAQERGLRPGTQDAVACAGFAVACDRARTPGARYAALAGLRERLEEGLLAQGALPGAQPERNGAGPRAPHVSEPLLARLAGGGAVRRAGPRGGRGLQRLGVQRGDGRALAGAPGDAGRGQGCLGRPRLARRGDDARRCRRRSASLGAGPRPRGPALTPFFSTGRAPALSPRKPTRIRALGASTPFAHPSREVFRPSIRESPSRSTELTWNHSPFRRA